MNIFAIEDFMIKNKCSLVYIQSPRWKDEKIVSISRTGLDHLQYISIDCSTDEGVIDNTFDEIEVGNCIGRFLNSEEAALYDDFEIVPYKNGVAKFKEYKEIFEEKWR